ncbi:MAG TPA: serine protease, partial [Pyrinomonadaceae bacterium]|nr:serine protease [Pyrinomonadaceae bacterium]
TSPSALAGLPQKGVPNEILLAMIESDPLGSNTHLSRKGRRMTAAAFRELQASVVTVWSEFGNGTGFIIDDAGLVLTSQHVVGPSEYIAVQFDRKRKVPAKLLASDPETDVAVLWINLDALPDASVAPLAEVDEPAVVEGERVVTIGSLLPERKTFTTGIAGKLNKRSITSDLNLNRSDSGCPLFNSLGEAVGIATYLRPDVSGFEIYGILRIEQTFPLIEQARRTKKRMTRPTARFLPVDPAEPFPLDAVATAKDFDMRRYSFDVGEFSVFVMTPTVRHRLAAATAQDIKAFAELKKWGGYARADKPVLFIHAAPRSVESKSEFYKMRLLCGDREVEPILPAKVARFEATIEGVYAYSPKAISADCGTVTLEIVSAGNPYKVRTKNLDQKIIARVDEDFSPYYKKYGSPPLALMETQTDKTLSKPKRFKWWDMSKYPK